MTTMSPTPPSSSPRPTGRRPGDPAVTRAAIVDAARQLFGEVGFERATVRAIAAAAGVDAALVNHHFGGKRQLFVAAHELPFDPADLLADIEETPPDRRGVHIARTYLTMMEAPSSPALSMLRTAATNDDAARMLREFITTAFIDRDPPIATGPDGARRLALAGAQLIGVAFGRIVLELEPLTSATIDELAESIAPTIQRYLDDPLR